MKDTLGRLVIMYSRVMSNRGAHSYIRDVARETQPGCPDVYLEIWVGFIPHSMA